MDTLDYSPRELLPLLDLWDEFVWVKDDGSLNKANQPKHYPFQIIEWKNLAEAKKAIRGNERKGRELLAILSETTFSEKAKTYIQSTKIKEAVELLLRK